MTHIPILHMLGISGAVYPLLKCSYGILCGCRGQWRQAYIYIYIYIYSYRYSTLCSWYVWFTFVSEQVINCHV
jgi:hypothetical protein